MVHRSSLSLNAPCSPDNSSREPGAAAKSLSKKQVASRLRKRDAGLADSLSVAPYQMTIFDYAAAIGVTLFPGASR